MRSIVLAGLSVAVLAGISGVAFGARPATRAEITALQSSVRESPMFGSDAFSVKVVEACMSTAERGFAAAILRTPGHQPGREISLFHRNARLHPVWHMYGFASPQNLWFAKTPTNPYATRLRAERDLKANCHLPAWATRN
jgi:hypothetical protein